MSNPFEILESKLAHMESMMAQILACLNTTHKNSEPVKEITFTSKELAEYMGCSVQTINKHKRAGSIPFHSVCGVVYFKKSEIDRLANRNLQKKKGASI